MLKLKIPPAALFVIFTGMIWALDEIIPNNALSFIYQKWMAFICFGVGVLVGISGVIEFARKSTTVNPHRPENTSELVKSGIYHFSRNPMYLGLLMGLLAIVIYFGNIWGVLILPVFMWYMNEFQIKPEEDMMAQKFGEYFQDYKSKVRRWI